MTDAQGTTSDRATPLIDKLDELRTIIIGQHFWETTEARLLGLIDAVEALHKQALAAAATRIQQLEQELAEVREMTKHAAYDLNVRDELDSWLDDDDDEEGDEDDDDE